MEIILLERVEKLGQMGDVVKVKAGYARNYLLPRKKALRATEANRQLFEARKAQLEAENLQRRQEAEDVAGRMDGTSVVVLRQAGEAGQLYGSVNARDVALAVTEAGFTIGRQQVVLEHPIKAIGMHDVTVRLHPEVSVTVTVNVARSEAEATVQAETGRAVTRGDDDEEDAYRMPETAGLEGAEEAPAEAAESDEAPAEEAQSDDAPADDTAPATEEETTE